MSKTKQQQEFAKKYIDLCNEYGFYGSDGGCSCCGTAPDILEIDPGMRLVINTDTDEYATSLKFEEIN